ncbi:hypothetical protein GGF32_001681 [Allomyces javanicus]|nr:hypothetical protein GGF32_001681 [Allomyces javanicus]
MALTSTLVRNFADTIELARARLAAGIETSIQENNFSMCPWTDYLTMKKCNKFKSLYPLDRACEHNDIKFLQWWLNQNLPTMFMYTTQALDFALGHGNIKIIQFFMLHNIPLEYSSQGIVNSMSNGHIQVLSFVAKHINDDLMNDDEVEDVNNGFYLAAKNGHAQVFDWFLNQYGIINTTLQNVMVGCAVGGQIELLEWALYHWDAFQGHDVVHLLPIMNAAASNGDIEYLNTLQQLIPDFHEKYTKAIYDYGMAHDLPAEIASDGGHVNVLEWMVVNNLDFGFEHVGKKYTLEGCSGGLFVEEWWHEYFADLFKKSTLQ